MGIKFFTVYAKLAETAVLASKDLTTAIKLACTIKGIFKLLFMHYTWLLHLDDLESIEHDYVRV